MPVMPIQRRSQAAISLLAPVGGRLVDRHGHTAVVGAYLAAQAVACSCLVMTLLAGLPAGSIELAAALFGVSRRLRPR